MHVGALEKLIVRGRFRVWLMVTIRWMEMRVGAVERLIVLEMLIVCGRLMVMIGRTVMHVGAVGKLIVLGRLIVRGRLPLLWVLLLVGMWRLERVRV